MPRLLAAEVASNLPHLLTHIAVADRRAKQLDPLPRKDAFRATVSMDGYVTQEHNITSEYAGGGAAGFAGNVLIGGVIGMAVDGSSGAMKDLTPNPLVITLLTPSEHAAWMAAEADRASARASAAAAAATPAPGGGQ